ncbi:MAG: TetR/AcrR family transcriptional regulator [Leptolyngbya sp. SIO1E4]|nr:TetR/AcrR family transcriptional regulator [Leptolyngbya sp. SIO1E4]
MPKETYIPCLLRLFRQHGYDGATLAKISEATGLGKASLYHHFPGGKDEMVEVVLAFLENQLDQHVLQNLRGPGDAMARLQRMSEYLQEAYEGGKQPCILATLLLGSARDIFHGKVKGFLRTWIGAIATVLMESGVDEHLAYQRGENALLTVQGALILSQGLEDPAIFQRAVQQLPTTLCQAETSVS